MRHGTALPLIQGVSATQWFRRTSQSGASSLHWTRPAPILSISHYQLPAFTLTVAPTTLGVRHIQHDSRITAYLYELMNEYVYSQTTAATTVECTTSVQQIGQRQTESTNRKAPLMQHMNNVTHPNWIYILYAALPKTPH